MTASTTPVGLPQRYLEEVLDGRQLAPAARGTCHPEGYGKVFGLASAAPAGPGTAEFAVWVDAPGGATALAGC